MRPVKTAMPGYSATPDKALLYKGNRPARLTGGSRALGRSGRPRRNLIRGPRWHAAAARTHCLQCAYLQAQRPFSAPPRWILVY
jgi:hypothetical protein